MQKPARVITKTHKEQTNPNGMPKTWQDKAGSEIPNIRISNKNKQLDKKQKWWEGRRGEASSNTKDETARLCKKVHVYLLYIAVQQEVLKKTTEVFQISGEGALWWSGGGESGWDVALLHLVDAQFTSYNWHCISSSIITHIVFNKKTNIQMYN